MFAFIFLLAILNPAESSCIMLEQKIISWTDCSTVPYQYTIQFTQEFCEPPKIIIKSVLYSNYHLSQHIFKILKSTTTYFQFELKCLSTSTRVSFSYYWAALIDDKILVFNDFMQSIPLIDGYRTSVIPYPLQLTNYEITYLITSYSGGNPSIIIEKYSSGFNLYVTGVSSTQLNGLGVQIIAGLTSLYTFFDSISVTQCVLKTYFPNMSGFKQQRNQIMIEELLNINDEIYQIEGSFEYKLVGYFNTCTSSIYINFKLYIYEVPYYPHYYKKIRVAQMMSLDYKFIDSFDTQRLYFIEANQTWIDNNIPNSIINYNEGQISLVYSHQCQPNRKIIVTILRKDKQGEYNYIYSLYCHRVYNLITMYINLFSLYFDFYELQFSLTDQGVQIHEKILQTGDTFQLLNIEYQV